jgi:hypothetical protein
MKLFTLIALMIASSPTVHAQDYSAAGTTSSQDIQITGEGGARPSVSLSAPAAHMLLVKITPMQAPHLEVPGYENYTFPYGCIQLSVTVNGTSQKTKILRVEGMGQSEFSPCKNAETSQELNFSNYARTDGNQVIAISNALYDNCRETNPLYYGCKRLEDKETKLTPLFITHEVKENVSIQSVF